MKTDTLLTNIIAAYARTDYGKDVALARAIKQAIEYRRTIPCDHNDFFFDYSGKFVCRKCGKVNDADCSGKWYSVG